MGDQEVLPRTVQPETVPLFPRQGNQVGDQPRLFPTKVMIRKLQRQIDLVKGAMEEVKRKSTSSQKEKELVLFPRVELLLAGLVLVLM